MILLGFILIPLIGGLIAWGLSGRNTMWTRWVSLTAMLAGLALSLMVWAQHYGQEVFTLHGPWLAELDWPWIPQVGIRFHLAMDGLSLPLVVLTYFLGVMSVAASWRGIQDRVGFFHFNLLGVLAGVIGVFLAMDLFLFYFFWEVMLVPLYFLIALWGHERRIYAAVKFFIFTQASGLLMLLGILGLYFVHGRATGVYTFDYFQLLGTEMDPATGFWLMLGFFIAFAVKLPAFPLHTWLPDAHTEAPVAGSVDLAGLVLKVGAYGLLRFVIPLFPQAALNDGFRTLAMTLAVIGILYGAVLAMGQRDLKRLVAYTSVSHMGFVLLGVFAWNEIALQGVVMVMIAHGVSTGALFILVGQLHERVHTRDMTRMGGLWATAPRMGGAMMFFTLATLGLPGLANFVGEFLVLLGTYPVSPALTVLAAMGMVASVIYSVWIIQRVLHGPNTENWKIADLRPREAGMLATMIAVTVFLGLYPRPIFDTARPALQEMQRLAAEPTGTAGAEPTMDRGGTP